MTFLTQDKPPAATDHALSLLSSELQQTGFFAVEPDGRHRVDLYDSDYFWVHLAPLLISVMVFLILGLCCSFPLGLVIVGAILSTNAHAKRICKSMAAVKLFGFAVFRYGRHCSLYFLAVVALASSLILLSTGGTLLERICDEVVGNGSAPVRTTAAPNFFSYPYSRLVLRGLIFVAVGLIFLGLECAKQLESGGCCLKAIPGRDSGRGAVSRAQSSSYDGVGNLMKSCHRVMASLCDTEVVSDEDARTEILSIDSVWHLVGLQYFTRADTVRGGPPKWLKLGGSQSVQSYVKKKLQGARNSFQIASQMFPPHASGWLLRRETLKVPLSEGVETSGDFLDKCAL